MRRRVRRRGPGRRARQVRIRVRGETTRPTALPGRRRRRPPPRPWPPRPPGPGPGLRVAPTGAHRPARAEDRDPPRRRVAAACPGSGTADEVRMADGPLSRRRDGRSLRGGVAVQAAHNALVRSRVPCGCTRRSGPPRERGTQIREAGRARGRPEEPDDRSAPHERNRVRTRGCRRGRAITLNRGAPRFWLRKDASCHRSSPDAASRPTPTELWSANARRSR